LDDAYQYLCTRANLKDPDERMRLARRSQRNGLSAQARVQAEAALVLRPGDAAAQQLLRAIAVPSAGQTASPPPAKETRPAPTGGSAQEQDYKPETLVEYTRQIQPILMNGCGLGSCHGNNQRSGYELYRAPAGAQLNALQTRQNLVRTLALVNRDEVEQSPLLRIALQPHGGSARPPLGGSDSPAYRNLSAWVGKLANRKAAEPVADSAAGTASAPPSPGDGSTGFASDREDQPSKPRPKADPGSAPQGQKTKPESPVTANGAKNSSFAAGTAEPTTETSPAAMPASKPSIKGDPFDPEVFNQQFHPKK
jgi:hypothetical protein